MFFPKKYGDPVIRNVGGRVTPATLQTMGMLGEIAQREGGPPMGFHLVVLHHTHCGIAHLEGQPDQAFELLWYRPGRLPGQSGHRSARGGGGRCGYPEARSLALPANWLVSGLVYDVTTGLVEVVVPPAP